MHVKHFRLVIFKLFTLLMVFSLLSLRILYLCQDNPAPTALSRTSKAASVVLFWPEKRQRKGAQETKTLKKMDPIKSQRCLLHNIINGLLFIWYLSWSFYLIQLQSCPICLRRPLQLLQITSSPQVILIKCEWSFKALYCPNFPS